MSSVLARCESAFYDGLRPDPELSVRDWADRYRYLTGVSSPEPGKYRTMRTPYMAEPMDALSIENPARRVVLEFAAQTGKTTIGENWIGYVIHHAPNPTLFVQPTVELAKRVSKSRIAPMIEATPVLAERVTPSRSKDSGNTVQMKEFKGGVLIFTGANSAAGLRMMAVCNLFMDEVDAYPGDVEGEGDPVALAEARTTNYARRKMLYTSTPTIRGLSRIEALYAASDQRRFHIPCPHCGHMDVLTWTGFVDYLKHQDGGHHRIEWDEGKPATARMVCGGCGERIEERHKTQMLARGVWRPGAEGDGITRGYHLNALYSPLGWKSWAKCVQEFLAAKRDPFRLKVFVNTVLAETWEESGDSVEVAILRSRIETYKAEVPHGSGILVAAVDVQDDRLEVVVKGFGADEESWLVAFSQILGDPAQAKVWFDLDQFLGQEFKHEGGQTMVVQRAVVDSGGHHTEAVYRYCAARGHLGVFAIKGGSESGKPLVTRPSNQNRYRVPLFVLCVDTGKEVVMSRLRVGTPGPGYVHLPTWVDDEYLEQLTSEKAVRKYVSGRGAVREWVKLRERNEAFDLEVYALAALHICGPTVLRTLAERAAAFSQPPSGEQSRGDFIPLPDGTGPAPAAPARRKKSWVTGWSG
jgi:phage terminase large subunit GpA-like protein